ncbi:MAG: hypothetical protein ACREXY_04925 [Gammaproteobacteria bacterium]
MAVTLSITVTDAQAARALVAFGHFEGSPPVWVNATANDVRANILNYAKNRVLEYETALAAAAKRDAVGSETW